MNIDKLSSSRICLSAPVGNYILFGGSKSNSGYSGVVDAYDSSLTRTTITPLVEGKGYMAATHVGNYALFAGGSYYSTSNYTTYPRDTVDAYNTSLTKLTAPVLSSVRNRFAGANVGNYALFAGGKTGYTAGSYTNVVDTYNTSLTKSTASALSDSKSNLCASDFGEYAVFSGGRTADSNTSVSAYSDFYNESLTKTARNNSYSAEYQAATTNGVHAIILGGTTSGNYAGVTNNYNAYDTSLTRLTGTASVKRNLFDGGKLDAYAFFAGGQSTNGYQNTKVDTVEMFDQSLTKTAASPLSVAKQEITAGNIGNYLLFVGGSPNGDTVDAYEKVNVRYEKARKIKCIYIGVPSYKSELRKV